MIDTHVIDEVANGKYTRGTYVIDDEKKLVSYELFGGAVSIAVIEQFVKLSNHTGYTFQTKFNGKELSVSPGMTEEQVKKNFFGENYKPEADIDTYAIDKVANGKYTRGTYVVDKEKKVVSYELFGGAVSIAVIEQFVQLANHTGYTFQTKFNEKEISISPGMTEEQALEKYIKSKRTNLSESQNTQTAQESRDAPQVKRNIFNIFGLFKRGNQNG